MGFTGVAAQRFDKPHVPPIVEITHEYDRASNRTNRLDETPTYAWDHRHQEYDYDGLHRLKEARRGVRDGGFTHSSMQKSREWELDALGNWTKLLEWDTSSYATAEAGEGAPDRLHPAITPRA